MASSTEETAKRLRTLKKCLREKHLSPSPKPSTEKSQPVSERRKIFRDFLSQQQAGMSALASAGVIGLHMVSGPLVGFGLGYALDWFFGCHPWGKIIFLIVGIGAGFLNVYRDTKILLARMATRSAAEKAAAKEPRS